VPDPNLGTLDDVRRCYQALDLQVRKLATALAERHTEAREVNLAYSNHGA
jgi:hypothetical protein